jgi:hypothetical protein
LGNSGSGAVAHVWNPRYLGGRDRLITVWSQPFFLTWSQVWWCTPVIPVMREV